MDTGISGSNRCSIDSNCYPAMVLSAICNEREGRAFALYSLDGDPDRLLHFTHFHLHQLPTGEKIIIQVIGLQKQWMPPVLLLHTW